MTWDQKFLGLALHVAGWSKDTSTQVGCVIVGPDHEVRALGYNGMPRGIDDNVPERQLRPDKYSWMEHSERNAIYNAARIGTALKDCTLYVTSKPTKLPCCVDCARAIIQAGLFRVVQEPVDMKVERWRESCELAMAMFAESGVLYHQVG